jgi:hypothetical protein
MFEACTQKTAIVLRNLLSDIGAFYAAIASQVNAASQERASEKLCPFTTYSTATPNMQQATLDIRKDPEQAMPGIPSGLGAAEDCGFSSCA